MNMIQRQQNNAQGHQSSRKKFGKLRREIKDKTVTHNSKLQQYDIIGIPEELIQKTKN